MLPFVRLFRVLRVIVAVPIAELSRAVQQAQLQVHRSHLDFRVEVTAQSPEANT